MHRLPMSTVVVACCIALSLWSCKSSPTDSASDGGKKGGYTISTTDLKITGDVNFTIGNEISISWEDTTYRSSYYDVLIDGFVDTTIRVQTNYLTYTVGNVYLDATPGIGDIEGETILVTINGYDANGSLVSTVKDAHYYVFNQKVDLSAHNNVFPEKPISDLNVHYSGWGGDILDTYSYSNQYNCMKLYFKLESGAELTLYLPEGLKEGEYPWTTKTNYNNGVTPISAAILTDFNNDFAFYSYWDDPGGGAAPGSFKITKRTNSTYGNFYQIELFITGGSKMGEIYYYYFE